MAGRKQLLFKSFKVYTTPSLPPGLYLTPLYLTSCNHQVCCSQVSSASLPSAPAPAPVVSEAPPPEGNVTLSYQPPSDLSAGAYPTGTPPAAAAPVEAAAPSPVSTVPALAPAPVQAAVPAPAQSAQVAAAAPTPLQAPAPGPGEVASAAPAPAPVTSMVSISDRLCISSWILLGPSGGCASLHKVQ